LILSLFVSIQIVQFLSKTSFMFFELLRCVKEKRGPYIHI